MPANITADVAAAAVTLTDHDWIVEEGFTCAGCGHEFEAGQQTLTVYAPELSVGDRDVVVDIHLVCYQGETIRQ